MNELKGRHKIAGKIVTSCSPSALRDDIVWPDGFKQAVTLPLPGQRGAANPMTFTHPRNPKEAVLIYRRGSTEWEDVLRKIEEFNAGIAARKAQIERESAALLASVGAEGDAELGIAQDEHPAAATGKVCNEPAPHFDCPDCTTSDDRPTHFKTEATLRAHGRQHVRELARQR